MATSTTSTVYALVIEDVANKVRDEFVNDGGPGEAVLNELQEMWEMKMIQAGVLSCRAGRSLASKSTPGGGPPVGDLNMPYEATEEYETPTAEILFPPTPLQTPIQTPLPGVLDNPGYMPAGTNDYTATNDSNSVHETKAGRPSPYMPPPSPWMNQRPLGVDVNVAYVEGREEVDRGTSNHALPENFFMAPSGKRKREDLPSNYHAERYIPQQDGAGDSASEASLPRNSLGKLEMGMEANREMVTGALGFPSSSPQLDGPTSNRFDDALSTPNMYHYHQGVVNEDYTIANTPAPNDIQAGTPAPGIILNDAGEDDDSEPSLNENDDDDDLDEVEQGEELNTRHLVLAQFDKVTRAKSRWKCILKDGIMHINDKDILFNKANGEFEF